LYVHTNRNSMLHRELLLLGGGAEQTRGLSSGPSCSSDDAVRGTAVRLDDWSSDADYDQGCWANAECAPNAGHSRNNTDFPDAGQRTAGYCGNAKQRA
jgi:hypothetical protein